MWDVASIVGRRWIGQKAGLTMELYFVALAYYRTSPQYRLQGFLHETGPHPDVLFTHLDSLPPSTKSLAEIISYQSCFVRVRYDSKKMSSAQ
jgi:hypothetical protein